jgi:hypothetical protein
VVNLRLLSNEDPLVRGATQTYLSFPETPVAITDTQKKILEVAAKAREK